MIAFLVAGLILGVLARVLHRGGGEPSLLVALAVGVVGAVVGGAAMNLVLSDPLTDLNAWSFTAACVLSFVLLGLVEGVGRKRA
jgi:uncharacterized membrane protein YeaQ/YmgE (transglycosylase-associated protein family)